MPYDLNSKECSRCHNYHATAKGLCRNCWADDKGDPDQFDPGIVHRRQVRERELASGKLSLDAIELDRIEARDRPPPMEGPGLVPKGPTT